MSLPLSLTLAAGLSLAPCHLPGVAQAVECGTLQVPANRQARESGTLAMHVVRIPATEDGHTPVFFLPGGPGQAGSDIIGVARAILHRANRRHDLVIPDFRGTGRSGALGCALDPELMVDDPEQTAQAVADCRDALQASGIDLRHYTSAAIADDMADLAAALGYSQINLYGGSYGTRAAQVIMRRHPGLVRAAVLDAVAPLGWTIGGSMGADAQQALQAVIAACQAQPACGQAFPAIEAQLRRVLETVAETTPEVVLPNPRTGIPEPVEITPLVLAGAVRGVLYSAPLTRLLPWMIAQADAGNFAPLHAAAHDFAADMDDSISLGMMLSVLCHEDVGRLRGPPPAAEIRSFAGTAVLDFWGQACGAWPVQGVDADFDVPVSSAIPTLILSGAWDPVTPPRNGEALLATLPRARHLVATGTAHIAGYRGCMPALVDTFLETADPQAPDAACLDGLSTPAFMTSALAPGLPQDEAQP